MVLRLTKKSEPLRKSLVNETSRRADIKSAASIWRSATNSSRISIYQQPVDLRVKAVIDFLLAAEDLSVLDCGIIAQRVHLSDSRLRHLFKQNVGFSFQNVLKLIKLQKATMLLKRSYLSIKEIGARIGFNDISHFVRDFKKVYGLRPSEFRLHGDNSPKRSAKTGNANQ
jgi:AraC family transcriptional regulator of arabinose operon